jgi:hypothetical protein
MSEPATRLPRPETPVLKARPRRWRTGFKVTLGILGGLVVLIVIGLLSLNLFEDRIRGYLEQQLNTRVQGYHFELGGLDLHPLSLSWDFENLVVQQKEHPDPPIAYIPKWSASLQWRQLLRGHVVSYHHVERPVFFYTRPQAKKQVKDIKEAVEKEVAEQKKQSWQQLVTTIYPVTINQFKVEGAEVTYVEAPSAKPLRLTGLNIHAGNIRNVRSEPHEYPSSLLIEANLGDGGRITVDGRANFFSEPIPAIYMDLQLEGVALTQLLPIAERYHVKLRGGTLSASGHVEVGPHVRFVQLQRLTLDGVRVDYIYMAKANEPAKKAAQKVVEAERKPAAGDRPKTVVKVAEAKITNSEFGMVNTATKPEYRVFLSNTDAELKNVSTHPRDGVGVVRLTGKFMGSGDTRMDGAFRPETKVPDFDLALRIENTQMATMNDILRAYGKFDVTEGRFSVFSELTVRAGGVEGYVKPLFQDMKVYDRRQDKNKGVLQQIYEAVVGDVSGLLENASSDSVATKADISGQLDRPDTGTWEAVARLLQNAFVRAILPGFDRGAGEGKHG